VNGPVLQKIRLKIQTKCVNQPAFKNMPVEQLPVKQLPVAEQLPVELVGSQPPLVVVEWPPMEQLPMEQQLPRVKLSQQNQDRWLAKLVSRVV
jgi:hypothetical protein